MFAYKDIIMWCYMYMYMYNVYFLSSGFPTTVGGILAISSLNIIGWLLLQVTHYGLKSWYSARTGDNGPSVIQKSEEIVSVFDKEIAPVENATQCEPDQAIVQNTENESVGTDEQDSEQL